MDTSKLRSFAVAARIQLMKEVAARLGVALEPGSTYRIEAPKAVDTLERAIRYEGGGEQGRNAITERVAYLWFNRFVALRFMDVNGYTDVGVVSPQQGRSQGQPEILAYAKQGHIDPAVVDSRAAKKVTDLLDGTRRSTDPQGEAYTLLLSAYCRFWNRVMPFMFEEEGDYTELLIPVDLLAENSFLAKTTETLAVDDCSDVEVIGWLYQFYISQRKNEVFADFRRNKRAGASEIAAATQLFTPHWIVRYSVENSLGRLWLLNRPNSRLAERMTYYAPSTELELSFPRLASPQEIKVLDPACGSGHMLTYAFDLLYAIYEEEGYSPADIPSLILKHNLFGTEIDERAASLAAFALMMKARSVQRTFFSKQTLPNVCLLRPIKLTTQQRKELKSDKARNSEQAAFWSQFEHADLVGSLVRPDSALLPSAKEHVEMNLAETLWGTKEAALRVIRQAEYLTKRYHIVVTNPPYMGGRNMDPQLASYLASHFPDTRTDLFAAFIERSSELAIEAGYCALVTMQSWMFLSSFESLREKIVSSKHIPTMLHLGTNAFDSIGGDVVSITVFVIRNASDPQLLGAFIRAVEGTSEAQKKAIVLDALREKRSAALFPTKLSEFAAIPGKPLVYWLSAALRSQFEKHEALSSEFSAMNGMTTGENAKFLRYWYEVSMAKICFTAKSAADAVSSGAKWFPYNKGGGYRKWFGNTDYVINWEQDGRDVIENGRAYTRGRRNYFKAMVSWSKIGSGLPSFRYYPHGFLFDVAGTSIFPKMDRDVKPVTGLANSVVTEKLLGAISPTLNFESGHISSLPFVEQGLSDRNDIVSQLIDLSREDWNSAETAWGFDENELVRSSSSSVSLEALIEEHLASCNDVVGLVRDLEVKNNQNYIEAYGLENELSAEVSLERISLLKNPVYQFGPGKSDEEYRALLVKKKIEELVSYAVGCMFGRYSLDMPGLILARQGSDLRDYLSQIDTPRFRPDANNVIPILDGEWFADDIAMRFRQFLRIAFGERHFEENLLTVESALGKTIRRYFVSDFYKNHVQQYRKRPIYWLFSSSQGSFNALIYMHRYKTSTVSIVLNEYLREFQAKLSAELQSSERVALTAQSSAREKARALKEMEEYRKILVELEEYEHDTLYPLATRRLSIDLDDGVKVNYAKFGSALKKIQGLEATSE